MDILEFQELCAMCALRGKNTRNVILTSEKRQAERGNVISKKTKIEQEKLQWLSGGGETMNTQNSEEYQGSTQ